MRDVRKKYDKNTSRPCWNLEPLGCFSACSILCLALRKRLSRNYSLPNIAYNRSHCLPCQHNHCVAARCEEKYKTRHYTFSRDVHLFSIRNNLRGYYDSSIEESLERKHFSPEISKPIKNTNNAIHLMTARVTPLADSALLSLGRNRATGRCR